MGLRDAIPAIRTLLAKGDSEAPLALAELGDGDSIPEIRKLLSAKRYDHRKTAACTALALLNDIESVEAIGRMRDEAATARRIWPALKAMDAPDGAALPETIGPYGYSTASEYQPQLMEGTNSTHGFPRYLSVRAAATVRAKRSVENLQVWLGQEGGEYPGLIAAAALARMGRSEGAAALLKAERLLFCLNAARRPDAWAKLDGVSTRLDHYGTFESIHRALAKEAALEIEGPPAGSDARVAWERVHQRFRKWGRPATLAEAFEMIEDQRWSVVLENDRLRVLPHDDAVLFWTAWAKSR
jgi:hypothetical protein